MASSVPTHLVPGLSQCAETYMAPCQLGSPGVCGGCARDNLLGDFCLQPQPCPSAAAVNGGFATLPGLLGGAQGPRAGLALNSTVFGPIPASSVHQPLPYPKGYAGLTNTCGCAATNFSVCHIPSSNPAVVAANPTTPCSLKIYGDLY